MRTRALTCSVLLHGQNANFGLANIFWSIGLVIVTAQSSVAQGTNHELACTAGKVQLGRYDAAVKPVLTIKSGDTVLRPRAETPTHFISMGLSQDLDKAAQIATRDVVDLLVNEKKLSREDALMLCSVALELRVTQLVDGTKGIHGMLPKSIFK
jgi:acetamidase/formamidase